MGSVVRWVVVMAEGFSDRFCYDGGYDYYFLITIMCTRLRYKSVFVAMPNTGYYIPRWFGQTVTLRCYIKNLATSGEQTIQYSLKRNKHFTRNMQSSSWFTSLFSRQRDYQFCPVTLAALHKAYLGWRTRTSETVSRWAFWRVGEAEETWLSTNQSPGATYTDNY